jgi:hypothetical protein
MKTNNTSCLLTCLGLSLATSPFIVAILTLHLLTEMMTELGETSEELFRSARLPLLNFPSSDR